MRAGKTILPIFLAVMLLGAVVSVLPIHPAGAQGSPGVEAPGDGVKPPGDRVIPPPSTYLSSLYLWFLGFVGIAALFAIVYGGVMYMLSGANITKTEEARGWITRAIWGIVLAAASYLILNTINPDLVQGFNLDTIINNAIPSK